MSLFCTRVIEALLTIPTQPKLAQQKMKLIYAQDEMLLPKLVQIALS